MPAPATTAGKTIVQLGSSLLFTLTLCDWLNYLFSSKKCLWVELGVSFVYGQWNDPPLTHIVPPVHSDSGRVIRTFSLPPSYPSPPLIMTLLINVIHNVSMVVRVVRNHLCQDPLLFPVFCTYPCCNLWGVEGWRGKGLVKGSRGSLMLQVWLIFHQVKLLQAWPDLKVYTCTYHQQVHTHTEEGDWEKEGRW